MNWSELVEPGAMARAKVPVNANAEQIRHLVEILDRTPGTINVEFSKTMMRTMSWTWPKRGAAKLGE